MHWTLPLLLLSTCAIMGYTCVISHVGDITVTGCQILKSRTVAHVTVRIVGRWIEQNSIAWLLHSQV
jgi:hypothetical protein